MPALNPLAKLAAPLPAVLLVVFVRDLATPVAFLALAYLVLLVGLTWTKLSVLVLFVGVPVFALALTIGFTLWVDPARVADTAVLFSVGAWQLRWGAVYIGLATGLRFSAIIALTLVFVLATAGADLARAAIQQLRVPYRIGYTALAAFRFVPRFRTELEVIRQAHRVRGTHPGRGPFSAAARWLGYIVPLMASAIRHAERVALAMDARAFGAYPDRTERHLVPFRVRDTIFILAFWAVTGVIAAVTFPWGLT